MDAPQVKYIKTMKNKGLTDEKIVEAITSHMVDFGLLSTNRFDDYFIDRAKKLLSRIEKATGKSISGRDSDETIEAFGCALS